MSERGARRSTVRLAAALLAGLIVAFAVLTYLSYNAAFASIDTVTVSAPRAGLVMEKGAKVKFRGIQIGKVEDINYSDEQARLTLAINSERDALHPGQRNGAYRGQHHLRRQVGGIPSASVAFADVAASGRARAGFGGAAGSQHLVPVARRPAAQDRPGRVERDAERAVRRLARSWRRPGRACFQV